MASGQASHLRGCIFYFFLFMAHGSVSPFLPLIWRSKGLSEHAVGLLGAIRPLASVFFAPVVCALADQRSIQQQVVYALMVLYALTRPSVLIVASVLSIAALETLASVSETPIGTLVDSAVRQSFGASGYGKRRMWGALGFGVASLTSGLICDASGGGYGGIMVQFVIVTIVALATATGVSIGKHREAVLQQSRATISEKPYGGNGYGSTQENEIGEGEEGGGNGYTCGSADGIPNGDATAATALTTHSSHTIDGNALVRERSAQTGQAKDETNGGKYPELHLACKEEEGEEGGEEEGDALSAAWFLLSTVPTASFFLAVVLSGMGAAVIDTFLFIRLEDLGGSNKLFGLARIIMCLAEVPFFYASGALIERMGARGVVAMAQIAYIVRFLYYSVLVEPWWVLPVEVLHGLTFATMWAAAVSYAQEIAPVRSRATVLGLVSGLYRGLGLGLGAMFGGYLYNGLGASLCFRTCSALPSISLLLLAIPAGQSWFCCAGRWWREGTGERGLGGWDDNESHSLAQELQVDGRKQRNDAGRGDVVGDGVKGQTQDI